VFDLSAKRELNQGFGNALNAAVELVVTPALMALVGWLVDRWLGTTPIVTVFFAVFTLGYVVWKQYVAYQGSMDREQARVLRRPPHERAR
jgi:F0F1-type ATP synthase assembly protein I